MTDFKAFWIFSTDFGKILKYQIVLQFFHQLPICSKLADRLVKANTRLRDFAKSPEMVIRFRNAKHTAWGARLVTPKGRTLFSAISGNNCTYYSTGVPTYWPTDPRRLPDMLDFFVARGTAGDYVTFESVYELSSDHSPIIATVDAHVLPRVPPPALTTQHTE